MDSPRKILRAAFGECLRRITVANGFQTDAGLTFTLEPDPKLGPEAGPVLTVLLPRQQRPADINLARIRRQTTCVVVAKVPADFDQAQDRLDAIVSDIELAMEGQQARFPRGYDYPQYVQMEPIPPQAGAGHVGAVITYQSLIPIR